MLGHAGRGRAGSGNAWGAHRGACGRAGILGGSRPVNVKKKFLRERAVLYIYISALLLVACAHVQQKDDLKHLKDHTWKLAPHNHC